MLPDGASCELRTFVNRVTICGGGGLPWAWPNGIRNQFDKMVKMSRDFRNGQSVQQWELGVAAYPCNYSATVDAVGAHMYEVSLAPVPGTERNTEAERQAFAVKMSALMNSDNHILG